MKDRKRLGDILRQNSDREGLTKLWRTTAAAAEFAPLPKGDYILRILTGELVTSKRGTPGYKLTLEVANGEFEGRRVWCDFWLTPAALPMTKRDLAKIGVVDLVQLEQPLPPGILIKGKLALRENDAGSESNRLTRFECIGIEKGDTFEPPDNDATVSEEAGDEGKEQRRTGQAPHDASFHSGANVAPSTHGACASQEVTP
jgi:hypothetical protein